MKKRFSKIISVILAIIMITAMLPAGMLAVSAADSVTNRKIVNVAFVLDNTGSMSDEIANVKNNLKTFADYLSAYSGIDELRFSLVIYEDITYDGMNSTVVYKSSNGSPWFGNVTELKNKISSISLGNGGDTPETMFDGLGYLVDPDVDNAVSFNSDAYKFAFVLTDADVKTNNRFGITGMTDMVNRLKNKGIYTSVVSPSSYKSYYGSLYNYAPANGVVGEDGNPITGIWMDIYGSFSQNMKDFADRILSVVRPNEIDLSLTEGAVYNFQTIAKSNGINTSLASYTTSDASILQFSDVTSYIGTALKEGKCVVNISDGTKNLKININVLVGSIDVPVKELVISTEVKVGIDQSIYVMATALPEEASEKGLVWNSGDTSIIKIISSDSNKCLLQGLRSGTTTLNAITKDGGYAGSTKITVTIEKNILVTGVDISMSECRLSIGETKTATGSVFPDNATNKGGYWYSSNSGIVKIKSSDTTSCEFEAISCGQAKIYYVSDEGAYSKAIVVTVPHKESSIGIEIQKATCSSHGKAAYMCEFCSEILRIELTPMLCHNFAYTSATAATCTEDGYTLFTCTRDGCGATKRDIIPALGHSYGDDNICDRCGHTLPYVHTHKYTDKTVAATCTEMGYTLHTCPCGASYKDNYIEPCGHKWDGGTVTTPKSCTSDGLKTYKCTKCTATVTEIIPAGHNWVETVVTNATCTKDGELKRTCADCGFIETEVIPAGHHWDEGTVTSNPTCTAPGAKICHCTECSAVQTFDVPALGHNFYGGVCQRCGIKFIDIVNENLAHPEYGMYFEIDDIVSNYGPDLINEYGVLLDYNSGATLDKVAVYLTQDGTMWRRCIACTGSGITYATYVPYLSYGEDIKYTGLNSAWINTFTLRPNADGIWNYSNYATIGVNLEDQYGNLLLSLYNIGKAGAKTRVFDDLDEMIAWLSPEPAHIHVHSFGVWEPVASAGGDTVTQLKQTCACGETKYKNIQTTFYTDTVSGAFNDTVNVDIYLQADSYLADLQLTFLYNSEMFDVTSVTFSPSLGGMKNATISPADSKFSLIYSNPELLTEDTLIATVTLKIKKNVVYKTEKAFRLAADGAYNICHTFFNSKSYVTEPHFASGFGNVAILGPDPNGDGELNIFDLFLMLSALSDPAYNPSRADLVAKMDCNKDSVFDIADITYLQSIIVSMN